MLFRTHIVFSLAVALVLGGLMVVGSPIAFFLFFVLGAAVVDIDSAKSRAGKSLFLRPLQFFVRHRGIFHSLFFGAVFFFIVNMFSRWGAVGFFGGYVTHLFLDSLTPAGVRFFWPVWNQKFSFVIRTGGVVEQVLFVIFLLFDVYIVGKNVL